MVEAGRKPGKESNTSQMPHRGKEIAINGRFLRQATTGVQRVAREVTRELDALVADGRYPVSLRLLCQTGTDVSDLRLRATKVEQIDGPRGFLWEQTALPQAIGDATLLCLGNTAPIYSLLRGKPIALMIHDLSYRVFPNAYRRTYRLAHSLAMPLLLKHADPIITVSQSEKRMLAGLMPETLGKVVVAQNGGWRGNGDTGSSGAPFVLPSGAHYGLYVGSLSQRKNIDGLISLATRLAREDSIEFVFVGSAGSILAPTHSTVPSDVASRIHFLGHIEDVERLGQIYQGASCLVFPSFYEASPLPPLEAMRHSCPVIASDIPAMQERCGDAADYCDPSDLDGLLHAVRRVFRDPDHAQLLVRRGHEQDARFSWRRQAEQIMNAILASRTAGV